MEEDLATYLSIADTWTIIESQTAFKGFPASSVSTMADGSSPYEAEVQAYAFRTTSQEVARVALQPDMIVKNDKGYTFKILTFSPDCQGWAYVTLDWQSGSKLIREKVCPVHLF